VAVVLWLSSDEAMNMILLVPAPGEAVSKSPMPSTVQVSIEVEPLAPEIDQVPVERFTQVPAAPALVDTSMLGASIAIPLSSTRANSSAISTPERATVEMETSSISAFEKRLPLPILESSLLPAPTQA